MRTIKFRAWHKRHKIMYWWDIIWGNHARGDGYIGMAPWGEDRNTPGSYRGNMVLIDPNDCEIMQFTGLTDKNGREIYEGDLINTLKGIREVKWNQLHCAYGLFKNGGQREDLLADWINSDGSVPQRWEDKSTQVIGNIYENPELLNDKKCKQDK